jgi:hypothetical protein
MGAPSQSPFNVIFVGMAGSGKTSLVQRANAELRTGACGGAGAPYLVNLDPAVVHLPFGANVDIRDTVNYKEVMRQYSLGPNGAIVTALNLFATRFDQVASIVQMRARESDSARAALGARSEAAGGGGGGEPAVATEPPVPAPAVHPTADGSSRGITPLAAAAETSVSAPFRHFLFDTPGQIEVFTWSASGQLIADMLAATLPTVVVFVVDTPRSRSPTTFMANMLYACSILFKTRLPLVVAFNKIDAAPHDFALRWMEDVESFQDALDVEGRRSESYMHSLTRSLSLALDEFYSTLHAVGVSAATGQGMDDFFAALDAAALDFGESAGEERRATALALQTAAEARAKSDLARLARDRSGGT